MLTYLKKTFNGNIFIPVFMLIAIFAVGLFHNPAAFAAAVALGVYLMVTVIKNKEFRFSFNLSSIAVLVILCFYLLSSIWAIDSGVAVFGFFRYLAVVLFMTVMMQKNAPSKDALFSFIAYSGAVMTVISAILMQFEATSEWFSVAGRLSGFWQYPNSFAMFLLCGVLILITKDKLNIIDFISVPILIFGILYSGSRIVFAIMIVTIIAAIIFRRGKKTKLIIGAAFAAVIVIALVYGALSGNLQTLTRFLSTSLTESTFVGRILYMADALPLALKYPFGMGYMGYYFVHTSVQTGVYSLSFVHNEFLQLVLDIGWVPACVFIVAILSAFFKKGTSLRIRLLLFAICAHSFFDFDLQYMLMVMLLVLCMDAESGKTVTVKEGRSAVCAIGGVLCAFALYFTIGQTAYYLENPGLAFAMYSGDTFAGMQSLLTENDNEAVEELSEKLIENNEYCSIAYSAKANAAFSKGDIATAMECKRKVLELTPFEYEEYEQYCQMLVYSIQLYTKAGDAYSAEVCRDELKKTVDELNSLNDRLSGLGKMIKDQPKTKLVGELAYYVKEYTEND